MKLIITILLFVILGATASARTANHILKYDDGFVEFEYSDIRYSRIEREIFDRTDRAEIKSGFEYNMMFRSGDNWDSIIVCPHSLRVCASNSDRSQGYWFDDGGFHLLNNTAEPTLMKTSVSGEEAYEVDDLCGTDECYAAVKSLNNQTISIVYWIGNAPVSAKQVAQARRAAWKILDSVKIKKVPATNMTQPHD